MIDKLKRISLQNKQIIGNMIGAFLVKGGSLIISVVLLPVYINFFENQSILGIWYTMLSVLNWMNLFDFGLGQGLRNQLPEFIEKKDTRKMKECISTTYCIMGLIALAGLVIGMVVISMLNWNVIFNVEESLVSNEILVLCARIIFLGIMLQIIIKIINPILYALQKSAVVSTLALVCNLLILAMLFILPSREVGDNLITMSIVNVVAGTLPYLVCTVVIFGTVLKEARPSLFAVSKKFIKNVLNIGISIFWLQLIFMVVSSTNEFLISFLTSSENVVEYQAYHKIFKTAAMVISLALTPIWSAVTRAKVQKNYTWIKKIYKIFLIAVFICLLAELCVIPILQWVFDIWLGEGMIIANAAFSLAFVFSSAMFLLHNVNTTIGNGLSYFRLQMIWMTVAAVIFIPLAYLFVEITGSWIGVIIANIIALVPYELLAPFYTMKYLGKLSKQQEEINEKNTL